MSNYCFHRLNSKDFEHLIQSLSQKIFGFSTIIFGSGPDGGREATFEGECDLPNEPTRWSGKWVVQAKFREKSSDVKDYAWVKRHFEEEMQKYITKRENNKVIPNNYVFFTNAVLTPKEDTGGRDRLEIVIKKYRKEIIPNIVVYGYDDLCRFLDNNRDVAVSYSSFILPGDILSMLYNIIDKVYGYKANHTDLIIRFLHKEFNDDMYTRLEQGGQLTDERVNIENVFIDLYATEDGILPNDLEHDKIVNHLIKLGNTSNRNNASNNKLVIIGGPGQGKSTIAQFISQVYRVHFLKYSRHKLSTNILNFISEYEQIGIQEPLCYRFPFRIVLKEYSSWANERILIGESCSVISYFNRKLEVKGESLISTEEVRKLMSSLSFIFIFDGLDEVPINLNRNIIIEEINNFIEIELIQTNCDYFIVATTRPQGYTKEFDNSIFKHLYLTDLDYDNCMKYLNKLMANIENSDEQREVYMSNLKSALNDVNISRLMKSPLQATIMAILVRSGGEPPRNRYNLFEDYFRTIFNREKQKGIVKILSDFPNYITDIHNKLGFELQKQSEAKEASSYIDKLSFKIFVTDYLENEMGLNSDQSNAYAEQILLASIQRLVFITEVEDSKIGFAIRSMQEYFAANCYLHNQPDNIIPDRLRYISHSAYWRNTYLFAVGYLNNYKAYLLDTVYSICGELNGISSFYNNSNRICSLGSWLALDILNESIFRGNLREENKFCNYLDSLFLLSPQEDHANFGRLPEHVMEQWVMGFIKKHIRLELKYNSITTWTIAGYLLKRGFENVIALLEENWPSGMNEAIIIKHYYKLGVRNKWFMDRIAIAISKHKVFEYKSILRDYNIARKLAQNGINIHAKLIQNIICLGIEGLYDKDQVLSLFSVIYKNMDENKYTVSSAARLPINKIFAGYYIDVEIN